MKRIFLGVDEPERTWVDWLWQVLLLLAFIAMLIMLPDVQAGTVSDPFTGKPIQVNEIPGSVTIWNAVDFDKGGEGIAYHDTTPGNCAAPAQQPWCVPAYRLTEDVDIEAPVLPSGMLDFNVLDFLAGEWLAYTVSVTAPNAQYTITLQVGISLPYAYYGAAYHIEIDGAVLPTIALGEETGLGWTAWAWRGESALFALSPGKHIIRVVVDKPYFHFKSVCLHYAADNTVTWSGFVWIPIMRAFPNHCAQPQ